MLKIVDTHVHLYDKAFSNELSSIIERCKKHHIEHMYMPNIDLSTVEPMLAIAKTYPQCKAMLGLHPCYVKEGVEKELNELAKWLEKHSFTAIGEVGLDFYYDKSMQQQQIAALHIQLQWAIDYNLPVVLHARESLDEIIPLLEAKKNNYPELRGILHCFTGNLTQAQQLIDLGFYLGIGGIVTFKNNNPLKSVLPHISPTSIVLETDSPYLAPFPYRSKRNEPSYLIYIIEEVSKLMKLSIEEVAAVTTANAYHIFGAS